MINIGTKLIESVFRMQSFVSDGNGHRFKRPSSDEKLIKEK